MGFTLECDIREIVDDLRSVDVEHGGTEARNPAAEIGVHIVKGIGKGVYSVTDEMNEGLLAVAIPPTQLQVIPAPPLTVLLIELRERTSLKLATVVQRERLRRIFTIY
jgi:hypothetical protein